MSRAINKYMLGALLAAVILNGCSTGRTPAQENANVGSELAGNAATNEAVATASPPPDLRTAPVDTTPIAADAPVTIPEKVRLDYSPVDLSSPPAKAVAKSEMEEISKLEHNLIVFRANLGGTASEPRLGYVDDDGSVKEIGSLYEEHYLPELSVDEIDLFGEPTIVVQGFCGANCAINYLLKLRDGVPSLYLELFGGLQFADLDNDNRVEMLAYVGRSIVEIEIYRLIDDQLMKVNINEALGAAEGVVYNSDSNTLEPLFNGHRVRYRYNGTEDSLELVK